MIAGLKQNFLVLAASLLPLAQASALIVSGTGPVNLTGCPEGAQAVANLKSSVGWWEGPPFLGSEWHILFSGDSDAFMQVLTNFAAIRVPSLDLVIHDGPKKDQFLERSVDWEFIIWNAESWNYLYNNTNVTFTAESPNFRKPVAAPRLDVYMGGGVDWTNIKIPAGVRVRDERASALLKPKHETVVTNHPAAHHP